MELDPRAQFWLFAACFLTGAALALLLVALTAFRALLGGYTPPVRFRAAFSRPLPLLGRAPYSKWRGSRRAWSFALTVVTDIFFCLVLTVSMILLLYEYHDGVVRPFAIFSLFGGLFATRALTAKATDFLVAVFALALAVAKAYLAALLALPFRLAWRFLKWALFRPVGALVRRLQRKRLATRSQALCRMQLALALNGLVTNRKESEKVEKQKTKIGSDGAFDSRIDRRRVSRFRCDEHRCHCGTPKHKTKNGGTGIQN